MFFFLLGGGALGPQPVDQEDRHADQDQSQGLGQRICPTRDDIVHHRAEQTDQSPHHDLNADEGNQIKIKTANGFHEVFLGRVISVVRRTSYSPKDNR